jgi:hypothetical protein
MINRAIWTYSSQYNPLHPLNNTSMIQTKFAVPANKITEKIVLRENFRILILNTSNRNTA